MIGETLPKTHPFEGANNQNLSHKQYIQKMQEKLNQQQEKDGSQ